MSAIYWTTFPQVGPGISAIGRANLDGTDVNQDFISTGGLAPGVTLGRDNAKIYWTKGNTVGRANHNGTDVNKNFITGLINAPWGVAVDRTHIYWGSQAGEQNQIGRANIDGTGVNENFITFGIAGGAGLGGVAVDCTHIYWTSGGGIGRADIDGSDVDETFIPSSGDVYAVAVGRHDGSLEGERGHIYWTNGNGAIGRARLDGTDANAGFITPAAPPGWGLAVDGTHIYWSTSSLANGFIARARLNGADVNDSFITGLTELWGLAVHTT